MPTDRGEDKEDSRPVYAPSPRQPATSLLFPRQWEPISTRQADDVFLSNNLAKSLDNFGDLMGSLRIDRDHESLSTWSPAITRPYTATPPPAKPKPILIEKMPPLDDTFIPHHHQGVERYPPRYYCPLEREEGNHSLETGNDELAFKNDLAHVLVWFGEDLTSQQQLTTAFTLAKRLQHSQMRLLLDLLQSEMRDERGEGEENALGSFNALPRPIAALNDDAPMLGHPNMTNSSLTGSTSASFRSWNTSSPTDLTSLGFQVHAPLFHSDFGAWLRHHRLHKYQSIFYSAVRNDRQRILAMTEADLEKIGVTALGARRKFLRLFELVSQATF